MNVAMNNAAGEAVLAKNWPSISTYCASLEMSTKGVALGDYVLSVAVRAGKRTLARNEKTFTKKSKAPWWNNRYGCDDMDNDMVPYPWTNMKIAGDAIGVWGRDYRFGKGLFPEQITTLGYPLLRRAMRLTIKTADGAAFDASKAEAKGEWTKKNRTRIEGNRTIEANGFSLRNSFWAEYDGLLWNTLTIAPKRKIAVASMELEIPLTKEFTDVINGGGQLGKLKPEGVTAEAGVVWLGNGDGGLQWLIGDGQWCVKDPHKAMRVEVGPEGATLRLTFIDVPADLDAPHEIQFGLIATPVRPKTWRIPEHPFYRGYGVGGPGAWFPPGLEDKPAADPGTDFYGGGLGCGCIYVHTSPANAAIDASGTDDCKNYGYEWLADPNERPAPQEPFLTTTTNSKSFRDYFVWRHWRYQQKYGLKEFYFDNPAHNTLGTREVMKRMYNVAMLNNRFAARDHLITMASNGNINMGYMGFVLGHLDGEQFNSAINQRQPTYKGLINPDVFRAEFMGHNFGWPVEFLGQGRIKREWVEANGGAEAVFDQIAGLYSCTTPAAACAVYCPRAWKNAASECRTPSTGTISITGFISSSPIGVRRSSRCPRNMCALFWSRSRPG